MKYGILRILRNAFSIFFIFSCMAIAYNYELALPSKVELYIDLMAILFIFRVVIVMNIHIMKMLI